MTKIGIDITSINRIEKMVTKFGDRALNKFLSPNEIKLSKNRIETISGFWATKEAFSKAIGTGIGKELSFKDIEIEKDKKGKPFIKLTPYLKNSFKIKSCDISITHDNGLAISAVIIEL